MKRLDLYVRLLIAKITLRKLVYDEGVSPDSALYGFLLTAQCCVDNALNHIDEFVEHD